VPRVVGRAASKLHGVDGATTYRLISGLAAEGEPGTDVLASLSKVLFSTTLSEPLAWPNTQLVARDAVEAVREMKDKGSKFHAHHGQPHLVPRAP
jgi:hypothetical protein